MARGRPSPAGRMACLAIVLLGAALCCAARRGPAGIPGGASDLIGAALLGSEGPGLGARLGGAVRDADKLAPAAITRALQGDSWAARKLRQAIEDKDVLLLDAVSEGDIDEVEQLIEDGADVDAVDGNGNTALMQATLDGELDVVRVLLDAGADVNKQGSFGATAIRIAVEIEDAAILELLLKSGADTEVRDEEGATPLVAAVIFDALEMVKILLKAGADPDGPYLTFGYTPLMLAAQRSEVDITEELLKAKADVQYQAPSGVTPLHHAAAFGNAEVTIILLDAGADLEAQMFELGHTPVLYAARFGNQETFEVLVDSGADLTVESIGNRTILHNAALAPNNTAVFELLFDNGLDINATDEVGQTPINLAAWIGDKPNIEILLSEGADPALNGIIICGCLDVESSTRCPADNCLSREDIEEIQTILGVEPGPQTLVQAVIDGDEDAGSDVNARAIANITPLSFGAYYGNKGGVLFLLSRGADSTIKPDDERLDEVCGCLAQLLLPTLRQCAVGACRTQEQIDEIEELLGGGRPAASLSGSGSGAATPVNGTGAVALASSAQDCASLPDVVAQLECVAAGTKEPS
eukprot:evm.model.scf_791.4 EVM.evm.TU.scf_791.4   scf_791:35567-44650(+)